MAQVAYRANLSAAEYPLLPEAQGASVIIAGQDQNLSRLVDSPESRDLSIGIPQLYYAENVLPTKEGLCSTQWRTVLDATDLAALGVYAMGQHIVDAYSEYGGKYAVQLCALGTLGSDPSNAPRMLVYKAQAGQVAMSRYILAPVDGMNNVYSRDTWAQQAVSSAFVQGAQFIHVQGLGTYRLFVLEDESVRLDRVFLNGLSEPNVIGIVAANGYLVAYTSNAVAWSTTLQIAPEFVQRSTAYAVGDIRLSFSTTNRQYRCTVAGTTSSAEPVYPSTVGATFTDGSVTFECESVKVDFVPSLTTGAGGGIVEEVRGTVITARRSLSGFILYTDQNMVAAVYTNNATNPYNFRALPNSAGIRHCSCVTDAAESGFHYALTGSGIMQVASNGVKLLHPGVQDWLQAGRRVELAGDPPVFQHQTAVRSVSRIAFLRNRYLIISRGSPANNLSYREALVYDTALDRFGQIDTYHIAPFDVEPRQPENFSTEIIRDLFLSTTSGEVQEFRKASPYQWSGINSTAATDKGVVVLGRYRHARLNTITLHEVRLGNSYNDTLKVYPMVTRTLGTARSTLPAMYRWNSATPDNGYVLRYTGRIFGDDISLVISGNFQLNSLELTFVTGGHR